MKKKSNLKVILNTIFLFTVVFLVLYFSLKDNFREVVANLVKLNPWFIILGITLALLYRLCLSITFYLIVKSNNEKYSLRQAFKLNMITQFFNGITPFATGGQPAQIYYLKKEGMPLTKSTNIILQNFIIYQISLVSLGMIAIIYNNVFHLFQRNDLIRNLVIVGFIINIGVAIFLFLISFGKKFNQFLLTKGIKFLSKIKLIKNPQEKQEKLNVYLNNFYDNGLKLKNNKKLILGTIIIDLIGLACQYSIPLAIIYGMGYYQSLNLMDSIVSSAYVMVMGAFIPTPGGAGGIEYGFLNFYGYFITGSVLTTTMLLWRSISYYLGMIMGGIYFALGRRKK